MAFLPINTIAAYPISIQAIYFALCFLIGVMGAKRKMGFWGYLFCSILLSPIVGLLVLLVSEKRPRANP